MLACAPCRLLVARLHIAVAVAVTLVTAVPLAVATAPAPDEAPAARAYLNHLLLSVDAVEGDLASVIDAADVAARPFIAGGALAVRGDAGLAADMTGRAGALAACDSGAGGPGDVVLYVLGVARSDQPDVDDLLRRQIADAVALSRRGAVVIAIASRGQLRAHEQYGPALRACAAVIDNQAPGEDGLFHTSAGRAVVPTFTVANAVVAWTFSCELFAACTRLGRTPVVVQSFDVDTRRDRWRRLDGRRFHNDLTVAPVEAGVLGRAYLEGLRGVLRDVGTASWPALAAAADRAADAIIDGGRAFIAADGAYVSRHHGGQLAADPWLFVRLSHSAAGHPPLKPGPDDFVIALGRCDPPGTGPWNATDRLRRAGRGVAWVINACLTQRRDLQRGELLVDLQWPIDDAVVRVPGYDTPIGPTSSVVAEATMWMLAAHTHERLQAHSTPNAGE